MTLLLLVIIYLIYIGLGLPDSTFGSSWPAIYSNLNLPVNYGNYITMLIAFCTILASFFSAKVLNKFGTGLVTAVSTFITALGLLGFSLSNSIIWLCICAIPLGLGAGAIDAALNNYVALHYSSVHLNILHSFYGIGVTLSPFLFSFMLAGSNGWRDGFKLVFFIQLALSIIAFFALPLWRKINKKLPKEEIFTPKTLSYKTMAKNSTIRACWLAFFASCGLEFTCGHWSSTYFVSSMGATPDKAALYLTLYYIGITSGRLIFGLLSSKISNKNIIYIGYALVFVAILTIICPFPIYAKVVALFLIGFGNGPMFPNTTFLIPKIFGKEVSQSVISSAMVMCNLGILVLPPVFGIIAGTISTDLFPYYIALLYIIMVVYTIIYNKRAQKNKNCFTNL